MERRDSPRSWQVLWRRAVAVLFLGASLMSSSMPAAAAPGTLRAAKYAQRALTEQPALAAMGAHLRPYRPMADMIGGAYLPSHVDTVARQRRSAVLGAVAARPRATGAAAGLRDLIVLLPAR